MTVREIAKLAQVSPATVSRFMTGAENVGGDKADRIREVLSGLHDRQIPKIRGVNKLIGLVVPELYLQYYSAVLQEIMLQIKHYEFQVAFIPSTGNGRHDYLDTIRSQKLSGLILLSENIPSRLAELIETRSLKTVICGGADSGRGGKVTAVHINDLSAGFEGTKYLLGKGHRKIAFLSDYPRSISAGFQRITGAQKALEEAGVPFHKNLWRYGEMTEQAGYAFVDEILKEGESFTAVFAFSDQMAVGAMNALYDAGLSVPGDVSVLGFDDLPLAQSVRPRLTTIRQPIQKIVTSTLDLFTEQSPAMENAEINIPFSLCERESCRDISEHRK